MFKVQSEVNGTKLTLKFQGPIDEHFKAPMPDPELIREVLVIGREVTRINSVGVKAWMKYFQVLRSMGLRVKYSEISPPLVEQFNVIHNFSMGGKVESMMVPFACTQCGKELVATCPADSLKGGLGGKTEVNCPQCGGVAVFDDIEDEYFGFLAS